jgi:hypothetical protein
MFNFAQQNHFSMKYKFFLLSALLVASISLFAQAPIKEVTQGSVTKVMNMDKCFAVVPSAAGKAVLLVSGGRREILDDDYTTFVSDNCASFIEVHATNWTYPTGYTTIGVSSVWIKEISPSGSGSVIKMLDPKQSYTTTEAPSYFEAEYLSEICGGGGGGGATNLTYTASPTTGSVNSDTGTDATVPAVTGTNAGLHLPIPPMTELAAAAVDPASDYFEVWDASAAGFKKILATFTSGGITSYNVAISGGSAGAALRVTATAAGVTCTYSANNFTITIPAGVTLMSAHLIVTTADIQAAADAGGFTDWVTATFVNTDGNTGVTTLRVPQVQKGSIPTNNPLAANNGMSIDTDNNPALTCIGASSNDVVIRASGMSVGAQGYLLSFSGF